ncbi:MAG: DMT family transporter, partial [Pseudomonadota bacterium]
VSLTKLEFATVSTLAFAGPMFVTALSVPVLGERVGPWRWAAVVIGFVGILLIMRPGTDAFSPWALLPVGAALGYATASVIVRLMDDDVPSPLVNMYSNVSAMAGAAVLTVLMTEPVPIQSWSDAGLIAAMGCTGGIGVLCLTYAYRMCAPSILAPFEYSGILFAFMLGWLVFHEAPFDTLFPGVLFIVGAGLLIVWRERQAKRPVPYPRASRRLR